MAKRPYNKKSKAETLKQESKAVQSPCVPLDKIEEITIAHYEEAQRRINYHLEMVKQKTGEILPEDSEYIMNLANREFWFKLKQEAV